MFRLFFDLSAPGVWSVFFRGVPVLAFFAVIFSLAWNIPWVQQIVPAMSLVGMSYGHNHLIDIIMFASPILLSHAFKLQRRAMSALLVLFWIIVTLTRARAAWVILGIYTISTSIFMIKQERRRDVAAAVVVITALSAAVGLYFLRVRPSSVQVRLGYWRQAVEGFQERPLFGNGPGTFFLVSLRHQRIDEKTSWFVHNQPLETLTELGVLGIAAFVLLAYCISKQWYRYARREKLDERLMLLSSGMVLIFIYGTIEYVLSYLVIWLLCWSIIGLICGEIFTQGDKRAAHTPWATLLFLFIFYTQWVLGNGLGLLIKRYDISFGLAPFDAPLALLYVSDSHGIKQQRLLDLAYVLHRGNPAILSELGLYYLKINKHGEAIQYLNEAAFTNPLNMAAVADYLHNLANVNPELAGNEMITLLSRVVQHRFRHRVAAFAPFSKEIGQLIQSADQDGKFILQEGYVSLLYTIGLRALPSDPALTKICWELARDIYPDFGPIHVELARYYLHMEHSEQRARDVLYSCLIYPSAKELCKNFYETDLTEFDLLPPGDYQDVLQ